jgi:hypothetical protein
VAKDQRAGSILHLIIEPETQSTQLVVSGFGSDDSAPSGCDDHIALGTITQAINRGNWPIYLGPSRGSA